MGVTGLWTVLQPAARPIKIETLNKKRLAVDASIWIYQFLKAVRDKEGNALRNSHIVGFFRRICKILFFGIKPVFVFDGGAPILKRQTINSRKSRREGRREDAVRTAGKLLALQMQRAAEDEEKKNKGARRHPAEDEPVDAIPENVVYAEEVYQTPKERQQNRTFKKKDQYHLPDLDASLSEMGGANDPRIMSLEELEEYARQFDSGEDINVYDFSKIDFDSPFFVSLPASDRYNILNAARLRSRLRMGYSKEQLDTMFPDRMAFSRFQIERVTERNELTQRLMNINGMADDTMFGVNGVARIAGDKQREYVLVKNDGVEGGWALGVVSNKDEGEKNKPIDVDKVTASKNEEDEIWEDDEEFEDVPIEGLNRLPKPKPVTNLGDTVAKELAKRRKALYDSRQDKPSKPKSRKKNQDPDSLFLAEEGEEEERENVGDDLFEEADGEQPVAEEEAELQRAIAMSLQQDGQEANEEQDEDDDFREVFQQQRVEENKVPFSAAKGSALAIARMANNRSRKAAPAGPFDNSDSEEDDIDLQAALTESRKTKRPVSSARPAPKISETPKSQAPSAPKSAPAKDNAPGFDGPLPFEKLDLGSSLLGKKKMKKLEEEQSGGFERPSDESKKKTAEPLPPWFSGDRDLLEDLEAQKEVDRRERERDRKALQEEFQFQELPKLRKQGTLEVIDLEASQENNGVVTIESSEDEDDVEMEDVVLEDSKLRMGDVADKARAEPPLPLSEAQPSPPAQKKVTKEPEGHNQSEDEPLDWSESETEATVPLKGKLRETEQRQPSKSPSPEFEDVGMPTNGSAPAPPKSPSAELEDVEISNKRSAPAPRELSPGVLEGVDEIAAPIEPLSGVANDNAPIDIPEDESDQYSDPEDADLFASLAAEAEEHARFASSLNQGASNVDFDAELKALRSQQKKDRRDADEVTQTMITECQHLLTLFGLPYVTAPMEAEAQCAELVSLGLVDGIVTDDSDTFLFGGTRVYKNMFNAAKFVECYLSSDLTSEFSLTREKLIDIAQLLGSDYTTGIPGIGPVTALEILSEFGTLQAFKDWWTGVQNGTIPKEADKSSPFRRRFRRTNQTKLFLPTTFPDPRVATAYLEPEVDDDPQHFQWGVPDLDALREFLSTQIGWSRERTDEVLVPVIRDMNRREKEGTQANITRFFEGGVGAGAFAPRVRGQVGGNAKGARLGRALGRLAGREKGRDGDGEGEGEGGGDDVEGDGEEDGAPVRSKRKKGRKAAETASDTFDDEDEEDGLYDEPRKKARKGGKRQRKAKA